MTIMSNKYDIVLPKNNEDAFIDMAKQLGTKQLLFLYAVKDFKDSNEFKNKSIKIKTGILATPKEVPKAKNKTKNVFVNAGAKDRYVMEALKPTGIVGFEWQPRKDFMHHRNSAINQVLAKIMKKNNVAYVFPVADLIKAKPQQQAVILGRMHQNIVLAKKYNVQIILASCATKPLEMRSLKDIECLIN